MPHHNTFEAHLRTLVIRAGMAALSQLKRPNGDFKKKKKKGYLCTSFYPVCLTLLEQRLKNNTIIQRVFLMKNTPHFNTPSSISTIINFSKAYN